MTYGVVVAVLQALWKVLDDIVMAVWMGTRLHDKECPLPDKTVRVIVAYLQMFFFFWFLTNYHKNAVLSFAARFVGAAVCYGLLKKEIWQKKLYVAAIYTFAFYGHTVVFVTPMLSKFRKFEILILPEQPVLNQLLVNGMMLAVAVGMTAVVRFGIDYTKIRDHWRFRGSLCAVFAVLEIYLKYILNLFSRREEQIVAMTVLGCIIMILILTVLIFAEKYLDKDDEERERQKMEFLQFMQYENMKERIADIDEVRIMYHDLKNHLLSLSTLADDDEKISGYLTDMRKRLEGFESSVETGNAMLNGLLMVKVRQAKEQGTRMDIRVNFEKVRFIRDMDICTLFGNAIDNALEATVLVEESRRQIQIRSGIFANNLVIRFVNSCMEAENAQEEEDGLPRTTKSDRLHHGLGLISIRRTVSDYQGTVSVERGRDEFVLKLMIPMQEEKKGLHR